MMSTHARSLPLAVIALLLAPPALAQAPAISIVFPPVIQRGTASTVTLAGQDLKPGSQVRVSGKGVTATAAGGGESLAVRLQVAADAAPSRNSAKRSAPSTKRRWRN